MTIPIHKTLFPRRGLIVSCQALPHEPLHGGDAMAKMAKAALQSGAIGIRTNGAADIRAIKDAVDLPVIGLIKRDIPGSAVFITPTLDEVKAVIEAGADIVALDVTDREDRLAKVAELIEYAHQAGACVMADVSTYYEGLAAEKLGADFIGTTLSGYTPYSRQEEGPDLELVKRLSAAVSIPVVAEGKIWTPQEAAEALQAGASYVVVGSAITRPQLITERYVKAVQKMVGSQGGGNSMNQTDKQYAIGVDVGGTKIHAGIVGRDGEVVRTVSLPTLAGEKEVLDRITLAIETLQAESAAAGENYSIRGIGIGTAGQVNRADGSIRFASDLLPGYTGVPVKRLIEERFGLPAAVDNDVNVLVLTEKTLGSGKGASHMLCLALGTGVGGAVMVDGKLMHGAWGGAGELGHMSVDFNGLPCVCGGAGCLEQYASGTGIGKRMRTKLRSMGMPDDSIDSREVFTRWQNGDQAATEVMDETFAALGAAIASLVHTFNPEVIVIGGGVAEAGEKFFERVREEAAKRSMASFLEGVQIVKAYQGNWSGMIGSALQIWESQGA